MWYCQSYGHIATCIMGKFHIEGYISLRWMLLHILTNDRKMDTSKNTQSIDQNASRNSIKDNFQTLVVGLWIGGKISIWYDRIFKVRISNILDLSNMQVSFCSYNYILTLIRRRKTQYLPFKKWIAPYLNKLELL